MLGSGHRGLRRTVSFAGLGEKLFYDAALNAFVHELDGDRAVYGADENGLYAIGWQEWPWEMQSPPAEQALAAAVSRGLRQALSAEDFRNVVAGQRDADDVVDTNIILDAAFREVCPGLLAYDAEIGMPPLTVQLWNRAWSLAQAQDFLVTEPVEVATPRS